MVGTRGAASATDYQGVACGLGYESRAMAVEGGAIVLIHRNDYGEILHTRASKVGENGILPGIWYMLDATAEFVAVNAN